MSDKELETKYRLSPKHLSSILKKLVTCGAVSHGEIYELSSVYREKADGFTPRSQLRVDLMAYVPIHDMESSDTGILRDFSEDGLRVAGIEASVGEIRRFLLPVDMFMNVDPIVVLAECRWTATKGTFRLFEECGFQMRGLSDSNREVLRQFKRLLVLNESGTWQLA